MDDNGDPDQAAQDICTRYSQQYEEDPSFCQKTDFLPSVPETTTTPSGISPQIYFQSPSLHIPFKILENTQFPSLTIHNFITKI